MQGLNDWAKVDMARHYYQHHLGGMEMLCFQEHKLRDKKLKYLGETMWQGARFFA